MSAGARPRLLDLFAGAGGAARGYQLAGFHVTGIDNKPQPRYAGDAFIQADALNPPVRLEEFDVIHASPPCQAYSSAGKAAAVTYGKSYPDLYGLVRAQLVASGRPWVIENVPAAPAYHGVTLCGSMFNLEVQRHRRFETSFLIMSPLRCQHSGRAITVTGHTPQRWDQGRRTPVSVLSRSLAMGIDWMRVDELVQSVPPAYTEFIGAQLMDYLTSAQREDTL